MKLFKRSLATVMALIMVLSSVTVLASATSEGTLSVYAKYYRNVGTEDAPDWQETTAVKRGEHIKARIFYVADFAMGGSQMFFAYDQNLLSFTPTVEYGYNVKEEGVSAELKANPDCTYASGISGDIGYGDGPDEDGTNVAFALIDDGSLWGDSYDPYLPVDYFDDYDWIFIAIDGSSSGAFMPTADSWLYEFDFDVKADAESIVSDKILFVPVESVQTPETDASVALITKQAAGVGGSFTKNLTQSANKDFEYDFNDKDTLYVTSNIIFAAGDGATGGGSVAGYIGDTFTGTIPTASKSGYDFLGWATADAPTTVLTDAQIAALKYDYSDITLTAVFQEKIVAPATASYTVNIFKMNTDGTYPINPTSDDKGTVEIGTVISSSDYEIPAYFTLDTAKSGTSISVTEDGDNTLNLYYARKTANVYYFLNEADAEDITKAIASDTGVYYGAALSYKDGEALLAASDDNAVKYGKKFLGWDPMNAEGDSYTGTTMPGYDLYVVASTSDISYDVTFIKVIVDEEGEKTYEYPAGGEPEVVPYTYGEVIIEPSGTMEFVYEEPDGYTFQWQDADGNEVVFDDTLVAGPDAPATIYGVNSIASYEINFYVDDELYAESPYTILYSTDIAELVEDPVKAGYHFSGWDHDPAIVDCDDDFYGEMIPNEYTISFFEEDGETAIGDSVPATFGGKVTPPTAFKEGYDFVEWQEIDGTATYDKDEFTVTDLGENGAELKLKAVFAPIIYALEYDLDDGTFDDGYTPDDLIATDATLTVADPTKEGYDFIGWATEEGGDVVFESLKDGETFPAQEEGVDKVKLYALYNPAVYNVTWVIKGEEGNFDAKTARFGFDIPTTTKTVTVPEGKYFSGWTLSEATPVSGNKMPAHDVTYVGEFKDEQYTIFFFEDDGTTTIGEPVPAVYGGKVTPPTASKEGYDFVNWQEINGTATYGKDEFTVTDLGNNGAELNLKAVFAPKTYTITLDPDNGSEVIEIPAAYESDITDKVPADPEKEGFTFGGWFEEGSETPYVFSTMPLNGKALKAKWNPASGVKYTVAVYTMDTTGEYGEPKTTVDYGTTDDTVKFDDVKPTLDAGFKFGTHDTEKAITADGKMIFNIYVDREEYTFTAQKEDGTSYTSGTYFFGAALTEPEEYSMPGYTFNGWFEDGASAPYEFDTMPAKNVTVKAKYTPNTDTAYTVVTYTMGTDGNYGAGVEAPKTGTTDAVVTFDDVKPTLDAGFKFGTHDTEKTITADGKMIFNIYVDRESYTITFADENGAPNLAPSITALYGAAVAAPSPAPEKAGYEFDGWFDGDSEFEFTTMPVNGAALKAKWSEAGDTAYTVVTYTMGTDGQYGAGVEAPKTGTTNAAVTFDDVKPTLDAGFKFGTHDTEKAITADGKMIFNIYVDRESYTITFADENGAPNLAPSITALYGAAVAAPSPAPEKAGYEFDGWFDGDSEFEFTTMPLNGAALKAKFTANDNTAYTVVTYTMGTDGSYGAGVETPKTGTTNAAVTFDDVKPALDAGFKFNASKSDASKTIAADGTMIFNIYVDRESYTITFADEDGTADLAPSVTKLYGAAVAAPSPAPEKAGYEFAGWFEDGATEAFAFTTMPVNGAALKAKWTEATDTPYSVIVYTMGADGKYDEGTATPKTGVTGATVTFDEVKPDLEPGFTFGAHDSSKEITADGKMTLSIYVNRLPYSITFDSNGGSDVDPIEDVIYGAEITAPEAPEKEGYDFAGWFEDGEDAAFAFDTMPLEGAELIAKWTAKNYTITFDEDGGSEVADITAPYESDISDKVPAAPTKIGYDFAGWFEDGAAEAYVFDTMPLEGTELIAKWTAKTVSLKFMNGDNVVLNDTFTYGEAVEIADPEAPAGYHFAGWVTDDGDKFNGTAPAEDAEYSALFVNNDDTPYTVEVYLEAIDGDEYELSASLELSGKTGDFVEVAYGEVTGFTFCAEDSVLSGYITGDGTTLKVCYTRNSYTAKFDGEEYTVKYGAALPEVEPADVPGKVFTGWFDGDNNAAPAVMPANDLELTSAWDDLFYTITFVINGEIIKQVYGYNETIVAPEVTAPDNMVFDKWSPALPEKATEDVIVSAVFKTDSTVQAYTVTFLDAEGETFATRLVAFGSAIDAPTEGPEKEFYTFEGWLNVPATMPAEDITIAPDMQRVPVKLIPYAGSTTVIDRDRMLIYGLKTGMTKSTYDVYLDVEGDGHFEVTGVDANKFGTGSTVILVDNVTGETLETYHVIIFGDIDGNSKVNAMDYSMAKDENISKTKWSMEEIKKNGEWIDNPEYDMYKVIASDFDGNGLISNAEAGDINSAALGAVVINQVTGEVTMAG